MLPQRNKKFMLHIILAAISPFCRGKGWQKVGLQKKKNKNKLSYYKLNLIGRQWAWLLFKFIQKTNGVVERLSWSSMQKPTNYVMLLERNENRTQHWSQHVSHSHFEREKENTHTDVSNWMNTKKGSYCVELRFSRSLIWRNLHSEVQL